MVIASQYVRRRAAPAAYTGLLLQEARGPLSDSDYFNRANETPPSGWVVLQGTWNLENRHLSQDLAGVDHIIRRTSGQYQDVEVRVINLPLQIDAIDVQGGVAARITDINNLVVAEIDTDALLLRIYKRDAGTWIVLANSGTMSFTRDRQYSGKILCRRRYYWAKAFQGYGALTGTLFARDTINVSKRKTGYVGLKGNYHMHFGAFEVYSTPSPTTFEDTFRGTGLISYKWRYPKGLHRSGADYAYTMVTAEQKITPEPEEFLGEDIDVECQFMPTATNHELGVMVRYLNDRNFYMAALQWISATQANYRIWNCVDNVYNVVASGGTLSLNINAWHKIKLRVRGCKLESWVNDANYITGNDWNFVYGSPGMWLRHANIRIKNFTASILDWVGLDNLAYNQPVTASSIYGAGYEAWRANDQDDATRYAGAAELTSWWYVDLGSIKSVLYVYIHWEANGNFVSWHIDTSDDASTWTTRYSSTTNPANKTTETMLPPDISARYVRIRSVHSPASWHSIWEAQIYGAEAV